MRKIGIALIGAGPGSQPHLASLRELDDRVDLRWAVTKSDLERARAVVPAHTRVTTLLEDALQDAEVDAVIVARPRIPTWTSRGRRWQRANTPWWKSPLTSACPKRRSWSSSRTAPVCDSAWSCSTGLDPAPCGSGNWLSPQRWVSCKPVFFRFPGGARKAVITTNPGVAP